MSTTIGSGPIVIPLSFDDQTDALIEFAVKICRASKKDLRLLHVSAPIIGPSWPVLISGDITISGVIVAGNEASREDSQGKLDSLSRQIPSDIKVSVQALVGDVASEIMHDAKTQGASLIICGASEEGYKYMPKSFSTVLTLMAESEIPVLAIPGKSSMTKDIKNFKVLISDDLSEHSQIAIERACSVCKLFANPEIVHLHVSGLTKVNLQTALRNALAAARSTEDADPKTDDVFETLVEKTNERLRERAKNWSGSKYKPLTAWGNVSEELESIIQQERPNLVVFGRHHKIHRKPLLIGQVPYQTMLSQKTPVLVVSDS